MRTVASRRLRRLGDVAASIALVASLRSEDRNDVRWMREPLVLPAWSYTEGSPPPVGRVLWQLAFAEEVFFVSHHRYAPHASDLDVALPPGWRATVLAGSQRRYQVRLEAKDVSCLLWGNRVPGRGLEEFQIDCDGG